MELAGHTPDDVERLEVSWPTNRLAEITLIDTPGIASISTDLSARTLRVLTPEDDRPPVVDAVLYLLRHTHASDVRFLESFHDDDLAHGTPMNAVGVLSRSDEIGSCRLDALEVAERVGQRYQSEPRLRRLCPVIVPVAGLLGHAAVTLREPEYRALATLAHAPRSDTDQLLLTADRFTMRPSSIPLTEIERQHLLSRLGLFGVRLCVELIRLETVRSATDLSLELSRRSGLDRLRTVLLRQFTDRSRILKAHSALTALESILRAGGCLQPDSIRAGAEQITSSAHAFEEVRLLDRLRTNALEVPERHVEELDRLLGGSGHDPASRLALVGESVVGRDHRGGSHRARPLATPRRTPTVVHAMCRSRPGAPAAPSRGSWRRRRPAPGSGRRAASSTPRPVTATRTRVAPSAIEAKPDSDQAFSHRVGDRMRPVPQLQPGRHVMQDVLHRPLAVGQPAGDLRGVVPAGHQLEHLRLPVRQAGEGKAPRRQHLTLQPADLTQQPAQQIRRDLTLAGGDAEQGPGQAVRGGVAAAQQAADTDLGRGNQCRVVDHPGDQHGSRDRPALQGAQHPQHFVGQHVGHDDRDDCLPQVFRVDHPDLRALPQLADHPRLRDRVAGIHIRGHGCLHEASFDKDRPFGPAGREPPPA